MSTTGGVQEHIFLKTMQTDKHVSIFFQKMLLGATNGEHIRSTFSVIYILLPSYFVFDVYNKTEEIYLNSDP